MPEAQKYKTIAAPATAEFRDRGSRFLAFACPVNDLNQIKTCIKGIKGDHPKAAHHCVSYRLGQEGTQYRASDDGEPSGSAGRPMLGAIDRLGLKNVLVVVVRYFGGTLLGVPGLIHAYGLVTQQALLSANITEHWVEKNLCIECDYGNLGEVLHILRKSEASLIHQDLQLFCTIRAGLPLHKADSCVQELTDLRGVSVNPV